MSLRDRALSLIFGDEYRALKAAMGRPGFVLATAEAARWSMPDPMLYESQAELYTRLSWLQSAVSVVANVAAGAKLNVVKIDGEESKEIQNHDFEQLIRMPNEDWSRFELLYATWAYYLICGNAYWYLPRSSAEAKPAEIWPIMANHVTPVPNGRSGIEHYAYEPGDGKVYELDKADVVHFKRFNPRNYFLGLSPLASLGYVSQTDLKMQEYNANYFGKENGKPQGALAFGKRFLQTEWNEIKETIKRDWGGTRRKGPLLFQGAGTEGASWINFALTQEEMQFLESRTFTKEEIYGLVAPGLSSILAVNATEANAKTGFATLISVAVWPMLTMMAEKITGAILPVYGDGLAAEFEDIRQKDRIVELQEQQEYARTHTIDEIRKKYHKDGPIGDERGSLLPAQVKAETANQNNQEEQEKDPAEMTPAEAQQNDLQDDLETVEDEIDAQGEEQQWKRKALKALKRGRSAAVRFEAVHIPAGRAEEIARRLAGCKSADEVTKAFGSDPNGPPAAAIRDEELAARLEAVLNALAEDEA